MAAKKTIVKKKISTQDAIRNKLQGSLDYILGSDNLRSKGKDLNNYLRGTPEKKIVKKVEAKKQIKKINPTTVVDKTIYGGDRNVKYTDKFGNTYLTNKHNGKTTYVKKDKSGKIIEGNVKNDMGKITPFKETTFKEIKVTPPKKETPAQGKTVSELWKEKTGTSWSEAKKQGLTDGSGKQNIALVNKLKSGEYKPKAKEEVKIEPRTEVKTEPRTEPRKRIADSDLYKELVAEENKEKKVKADFIAKQKAMDKGGSGLGAMEKADQEAILKGYKRGGSIKSKITATIKPKMAMGGIKKTVLKKPMIKAMYGTSMMQPPMAKPAMMKKGGVKKTVKKKK